MKMQLSTPMTVFGLLLAGVVFSCFVGRETAPPVSHAPSVEITIDRALGYKLLDTLEQGERDYHRLMGCEPVAETLPFDLRLIWIDVKHSAKAVNEAAMDLKHETQAMMDGDLTLARKIKWEAAHSTHVRAAAELQKVQQVWEREVAQYSNPE